MKAYSLTSFLLCLLCITATAQKDALTAHASQLFDGISCKLTNAEKNDIATLSTLQLNAADNEFYKGSSVPLTVRVFVFDLTNDGTDEVGISYRPKDDTKQKQLASMLFVKDKTGTFTLNMDVSGKFYFLDVNKLAFPDIYVRNDKAGLPVYRWNGNSYKKHTNLNPAKLKKYTISTMANESKRYKSLQLRE